MAGHPALLHRHRDGAAPRCDQRRGGRRAAHRGNLPIARRPVWPPVPHRGRGIPLFRVAGRHRPRRSSSLRGVHADGGARIPVRRPS